MKRIYHDESRNETFVTWNGRLVDPDEIPRHKRSCTGFCEGCSPKLGGCEDDNFELEDEADAGEVVPVP
jgi:hypothetical protein